MHTQFEWRIEGTILAPSLQEAAAVLASIANDISDGTHVLARVANLITYPDPSGPSNLPFAEQTLNSRDAMEELPW